MTTHTFASVRKLAASRGFDLVKTSDGVRLFPPNGCGFRPAMHGKKGLPFRDVEYNPEDGPRSVFLADVVGVIRRLSVVRHDRPPFRVRFFDREFWYDGDVFAAGWYCYESGHPLTDVAPHGPFPSRALARLAGTRSYRNARQNGDARFLAIDVRALTPDERDVLFRDVRDVRGELLGAAFERDGYDVPLPLYPSSLTAERELLRRIGGQDAVARYTLCLTANARRGAARNA